MGQEEGWDSWREQIIGLGAQSSRKSYYPELQRKLAESERFKALLNQITEAIIMARAEDGQITDVNESTCQLLGYSQAELMLMTVYEIIDQAMAARLQKAIAERATPMNDQKTLITTLHKSDDKSVPVEMSARLVEFGNIWYVVSVIRDITERLRLEEERTQFQQQILEAQQQIIHQLSIPIIPIMDGIMVVPLIGQLDQTRAHDLTRALLKGIREQRAKVVILDITGVPLIDSGVANNLDKAIQAARLKGARTIITGISEAVAESIVELGIDWSGLETRRDLQTGLKVALKNLHVN